MLIAQSPFQGIIEVSKPLLQKGKVIKMANKTNDLAHTKWMCKYHIVFTPKYRRKIIYNQYKESIATVYKGNIIKNLIMDCQSYTKYRPNETTGGIFVSWRRKEELPTGA